MSYTARWKTRGRAPGVRGPGVWKTRAVENAGCGKPKMRGLVENAGYHFFRQNMNFLSKMRSQNFVSLYLDKY